LDDLFLISSARYHTTHRFVVNYPTQREIGHTYTLRDQTPNILDRLKRYIEIDARECFTTVKTVRRAD
jgi:hypothetical protein